MSGHACFATDRADRLVPFPNFARSPGPESQQGTRQIRPPIRADRQSRYSESLSSPYASHSDLASWLLARETDAEAGPTGQSAAAERVCQKLSGRLARLVSPAGAQAILSRALRLARAEFPFLEGVGVGTAPDACFEGLRERMHAVQAIEASNALVAVLSALFDLLVTFIGEGLTLRLVREVWPDLPLRGLGRPGNSDGVEAAL